VELAIAALVASLIGFLAGLLTFRAKQRWCPECGLTLTCPVHHHGSGQPSVEVGR
jgi:hypothetical protein